MRPILTLLGLFLCADAATAATVGGVDLPRSMQSRAGPLVLATCGAKKTVVTHYVSAVYVPRTGSIHAIANPKLAKAVQIHITNDKFLPGAVPSKWRDALARAVPAQTLDTLDSMMKELRRGDLVTISYVPKEARASRGTAPPSHAPAVTARSTKSFARGRRRRPFRRSSTSW